MTQKEHSLWQDIKNFPIDDPDSEFTFTDRLARENTWSLEYAARVVMEYKRFIFLICIGNHPMTPSDQVDQAWHLHLLYTQSYWEDFCGETLHRKIHHGPTKGGNQEKVRYNDLYEKTKLSYQNTFDRNPPEDIWPSNKIRFGMINFSRVNKHLYWIVPKPKRILKWKY